MDSEEKDPAGPWSDAVPAAIGRNASTTSFRQVGVTGVTAAETETLIKQNSPFVPIDEIKEVPVNKGLLLFQVAAFITFVVGSAIVFATNDIFSSSTVTDHSSSAFTQTSFQIQREGYDVLPYFQSDFNSILTYKMFDDFNGIVEPHANTTVYFTGDQSDEIFYKYMVNYQGQDIYEGYIFASDDGSNSSMNTFTVPCVPKEVVTISVQKYVDDDLSEELDIQLLCMYVRREIRQLLKEDKVAAVNAMFQLWALSEEEGQALYGENFHNVDWFVKMHDFNAAWMDGDHFHEGIGFVPQHIKLTNWYESSIQAVDPSVSLFYWDYTYDVAEGVELIETPMFQDDTFGKLTLPANLDEGWSYGIDNITDGNIPTGLWANWPASPAFFEDLQSPYGYTRGPWNMNPAHSIVRYSLNSKGNPSCASYYSWLSDTKFTSFMSTSENAPHGSVHGNLGGVFGCNLLDPLIDEGLIDGTSSRGGVCAKWGFYIKEMYRNNFITPKMGCTYDDELSWDSTSCGFQCDDSQEDDFVSFLKTSISLSNFVPDDMDNKDWKKWVNFICNGDGYRIFVGDHLESASTGDPSFWPVHPMQDRAMQIKFIAGGFADATWPETADKKGTYVCNHQSCYDMDNMTAGKANWESCCYGHFEYDRMYDFVTGSRDSYYGPTNHDVLQSIDPRSPDYNVTYIYENFDWDHCDDDFEGLVYDLRKKLAI